MNICFINTFDTKGGAAEIMWDLKTRLEKCGVKTSVFVDKKYSKDKKVKEINTSLLRKIITYVLSTDLEHYNSDKILKEKAYLDSDLVHIHNIHGYYFNLETIEKISKEKPVIWTLHDMWTVTPHCAHSFEKDPEVNGFYKCESLNIYPKILFHNEKALIKKKTNLYKNSNITYVVPSRWMVNQLKKSILKNQDIRLIYNGIDTSIFKIRNKKNARKNLGITSKRKILLYVADGGKNNPWKGWKDIETIKEKFKNEVDFICLGGNKKKREENIYYYPYVNDKNVLAEYYAAADGFIYPTRADSFGLVAAESLSCGTPVISYSVGAIPEIVDDGICGFLAEPGNIEELIKKVNILISTEENVLIKMGKIGSEKINKLFNIDDMYKKYLALYEEKVCQ